MTRARVLDSGDGSLAPRGLVCQFPPRAHLTEEHVEHTTEESLASTYFPAGLVVAHVAQRQHLLADESRATRSHGLDEGMAEPPR